MRKIFSLLICVLLIGTLAMQASATTGAVFSLSANKTTVYKGEEVTVTVTVDITEPATSFGLTPSFDTSKFEFVSATCVPGRGNGFVSGGVLLVMLDTANPSTYSGNVGTYTLRAKADCADVSFALSGTPAVKNGTAVIDAAVSPATVTVSCQHTYGGWTEAADGHQHVCSKCGKVVTESHTYGDWSVRTSSTCVTPGVQERTCTVCGAVDTQPLPLADHTYGSWTSSGENHTRTCQIAGCGHTETEAHSFGTTPVDTRNPDCANDGYNKYQCDKCDATKTVPIPSTGDHNYADWVNNGDGTHTGTCTGCHTETKTEDHSWGDWAVETASTCTTQGVKKRTCSKCGAFETQPLPLADHTYNSIWTDCGDGLNHKHSCTVCHGQEVTQPHSWDSGRVTTEPTCSTPGVRTRACTGCNAVKTESIPATGVHSLESLVNNGDGTHTGTCSVCNTTVSVLHSYDAGYVFDDEVHWVKCACGEKDPQSEEAHSFTISGTILEKPTTVKEGKQEKFCVCGAKTTVTLPKIPAEYDDVHETGDITGQIVLYASAVVAVIVVAAAAAYVFKRRIVK